MNETLAPAPRDPDSLTSQERVARILELQVQMQRTNTLTEEEIHEAVRLLRSERVNRAGAAGGSKKKAADAVQSFDKVSDFF